jgi:tRNA threonylcarbamoyladenosine biosynthesis protein TsaB
MTAMRKPFSIAIETTARQGGLTLGTGDEIVQTVAFDAQRRHAVQLVSRLAELLGQHGLKPADLDELYVSAGPGSFTGIRVGITVARALAQTLPRLRALAVPTASAIALNAAALDFAHLGVVMDAKEDSMYLARFARDSGQIVQAAPPAIVTVAQLLADTPKPILLIGEGLGYHRISAPGIDIGDQSLWLPRCDAVWQIGRQLAQAGEYGKYTAILPIYSRKPEAVRLWEKKLPENSGLI